MYRLQIVQGIEQSKINSNSGALDMAKTPQVKPDWNTGIYIGNGVVAKPKPEKEKRIAALKANAAKITANLAARAKAHKEANS